MRRLRPLLFGLSVLILLGAALYWGRHLLPRDVAEPLGLRPGISEIRDRVTPRLSAQFAQAGLDFGASLYIRIFKEEAELELWVAAGDRYRLFRTYPICNYSGQLGPKLKEGDRQSPEGFYSVAQPALNPQSSYHLSFNLGFPNVFDRGHGRTGSFLMVHGNCLSIGCYAMTDPGIEEIYLSVEAALRGGQSAVPVHAFPFRMTAQRMRQAADHRWLGFWQQLQPAFEHFETTGQVPEIAVRDGRYRLQPG